MQTNAPDPLAKSRGTYTVEVFFDGDCPLCIREIKLLQWLDRQDRILFTDISADDFNAYEFGKTPGEFMDQIQGRLPEQEGRPRQWIVGVEVFRRLYAAVGFGWLVWPTRLPGISHMLEFCYRVFAKHRLRLTGRCTSQTCGVQKPGGQ